MITPYFGEFLISSCPLEMSLNVCSFKCSFCFANLNMPNRQADVPQIMRLLAEYRGRDTLTSRLLQMHYPTVISNHVDPFATSNDKQSIPIMECMTELGLPIQIQTRGGKAIDAALSFLKPAVWYISLHILDEVIKKRIEPGSPSTESRFLLMENLRKLGHRVILGLNPLVDEWLPEGTLPLLQRAQQSGAEGVWIERLHFNYKQEQAMTPREHDAIGSELITRAKKHITAEKDWLCAQQARAEAHDLGLPTYSMGQPWATTFFQPYHETYPTHFPVMQDFINFCHAEKKPGTLISFQEFADYMCGQLPSGVLPIDSYIGATTHNLWWDKKIPAQMTFRQMLSILWREPKTRQCPIKWACFSYAAKWDGDGWIQYVDASGMPYVIFDPEGFNEYYTHIDINERTLSDTELHELLDSLVYGETDG